MGAIALGLALALGLVGCGDDAVPDGERATSATTAGTAPVQGSAPATVPSSSTASTASTAPAGASSQSTVAPVAPTTGPSWDQVKDASIPALCNHPPTRLVDGKDVSLGPHDGALALLPTLADGAAGLVSGLRAGDGRTLTAVVASCNAGGVSWPHQLVFFSGSGTFEASTMLDDFDWASIGLRGPGRDGVRSLRADGRYLEVVLRAELPADPSCCPSASARARVTVEAGRATVIDAVVVDQG